MIITITNEGREVRLLVPDCPDCRTSTMELVKKEGKNDSFKCSSCGTTMGISIPEEE